MRLKETSAVSVGSERSTSVRRVPDLSFSHFAVTTNMGKLTTHEVEDIARRKRALRARLGQLEARLTAFTEPISGKLIEGLQELEGERGVAQKRLQSLRDELDIATRKLAIWYGRRQKLATIDPVDLASEVAVTSGKVKLEKEAFEMASWAYLQEVEIWRYNPSDEQLTARMNELGRKRALKRRALSIVVREAVEDAVAKADQRIAEKTLQRDQLQGEIDALQREIDFIKVLTSGSERSKAEKRAELEKERILATEALKELESLVSDEQEASIDTVEALEIVE